MLYWEHQLITYVMAINYLAVVASAVASMVIGSVWYGPLFGNAFRKAMGMDSWSPERKAQAQKAMTGTYVTQLVASLVMFYVFARFMGGLNAMDVSGGLSVAFWTWLGFVVPVKLGDAIWGGNMTLFWIGIGNMLVTLLATGAILGAWR